MPMQEQAKPKANLEASVKNVNNFLQPNFQVAKEITSSKNCLEADNNLNINNNQFN